VACSIPCKVIGIFARPDAFRRKMSLASDDPLRGMNARNIPGSQMGPGDLG
jgi:hypothetical protein